MLALVRPRGGRRSKREPRLHAPEDQVAEVQKGYEAIEAATGAEASHVFRTPGGNYGEGVMRNVGPLISAEIGWNIDSQDWRKPGAAAIANQVKNAWPGASCSCTTEAATDRKRSRRSKTRSPISSRRLPLRHHGRAARLSALLNLASAARRTKASFDLLRDRSPRDVVPLATNIIETTCFLNIDIAIVKHVGRAWVRPFQKEGSAVLHGR